MEEHFNLADGEFENQFADCRMDAVIFSHEAHLRLAWIHIKKYGKEQAVKNICSGLAAFVKSLGAEDKYNETLTVAAINAVSHFMQRSSADNFTDFINESPRLKYNFRELIATHYSADIYNNVQAKKVFLVPDLLPFD